MPEVPPDPREGGPDGPKSAPDSPGASAEELGGDIADREERLGPKRPTTPTPLDRRLEVRTHGLRRTGHGTRGKPSPVVEPAHERAKGSREEPDRRRDRR